ncbi:MAG TPA: ERF family protein [Galbitalea sp.]
MPETKTIPKVSAAQSIAGVMGIVGHVGKDSTNQQQNFKFRGIDAVMNAVGPALREVGGFIAPTLLSKKWEHGVTKNGGATLEVHVKVQYAWYGTDGGEPIVSVVPGEASDMSDKGTAKAMSVAYRTFLLQLLTLPTDDPDPDSEYIDRGAPAEAPTQRRASRPATPKGPTKATKDWWDLGARAATAEELATIFEECRAAGELAIVCDYDAEAGTANSFLRGMKAKKFADPTPTPLAAVPPAEDDPNDGDGLAWPVATIPRAAPTGDDVA